MYQGDKYMSAKTFRFADAPLQGWINELLLSVGGVQTALARLSFSLVAETTGLFGAFPRYVRGKSASAAMAALQSFFASKGLTWGQAKLLGLWQTLNNLFLESIQAALGSQTSDDHKQKPKSHTPLGARLQNIGGAIRGLMVRSKPDHTDCKQNLEDWEIVEGEIEDLCPSLDEMQQRTAELVGEISQLIDGCEELPNADWDELVAMLEAEQRAFKEKDYDGNETQEGVKPSRFIGQRSDDTLDDWEHVRLWKCPLASVSMMTIRM
ncbi:hypothetical protein FB567DRAFT_287532 [Paraphoma chrysanthemicola]|uniref:Uncharacterized protein n=1 Tax=Paraphoma chrysanthemicola TaxID=798071 RepID=A0A8K0W0P9_9PLEO|nr:hypothetical protein FB567DRAFT_287532 [Paraphoma chrysanthemicola]